MRSAFRTAMAAVVLLASCALVTAGAKPAKTIVVPKGTEVVLVFDQQVRSETAKVGDRVKLHVRDDVVAGKQLVIKKGTPVEGVISTVKKRKIYGVSAKIRIALSPVKSVQGVAITLEPRTKGKTATKKTGQAAAATAAGAIVAGPVGLVGGAFVRGKPVHVAVGDLFDTQVAKEIVIAIPGKTK